jgi:CRISPR/Cas system CSM-associated protein Csm2 small subunit
METQQSGKETASFTTELGSLVSKWFQAVTSQGKILTDRAANSCIEALIVAEEKERAKFRHRHGMTRGLGLKRFGDGESSSGGGDPNDPEYSDEDDVVDKQGMVSFAGVEDDDVNVEELKRILDQGERAAKASAKDGLKSADTGGVADTEPLFNNILSSIGDRVSKKDVGEMEKMTMEVHSLMLLVYKQNQELMKEVSELKVRVARQDRNQSREPGGTANSTLNARL